MSTSTSTTARSHLSSETIDLLLLAALPAEETNSAKAHLDECERCRSRWRELNEDKQRFEQFVFARTLPKVEARARAQRSPWAWFRPWMGLPAVGLAAAAVAVVVLTGGGTQTEDEVYVGVKGQVPSLSVYAQRGAGGSFEVARGATLMPKDRIRFAVNPGNAKYLLIVSKDGAGAFSVYHPYGATESVRLEAGRRVELEEAVELDETPGRERLIAVFSEAPVKAADLELAMKQSDEPKLAGATVVTLDFVKAGP